MFAQLTADVFAAFILGAAGLVGGGLLFEGGMQYVKTGGSNQFQGKIEAVPFLFLVVILGWGLEIFEPMTEEIVRSIPPLSRLGLMVFGSMVLLNYSVGACLYASKSG